MRHTVRTFKTILTVFLIFHALPSTAATFSYSGTNLVGVQGVQALGQTWNVQFFSGNFNDVYGAYPALNVTDPLDAQALALGLIDAMSPLSGTLTPSEVNGCIAPSGCFIVTPYQVVDYDGDGIDERMQGYSVGVYENYGVYSIATAYSHTTAVRDIDFEFITYTQWQVVPVPAAIWLFGSGCIGLLTLLRTSRRT